MRKKANKKSKPKAKQKTKAKATAKPQARAKPKAGGESASRLAKSPFLSEFRKRMFAANGKSQWPPATISKPDAAVADFKAAIDKMLQVALGPSSAAAPGGPGSAEQHVSDLIGLLPWVKPDNSDIPAEWKTNQDLPKTFRLYEIAWAINFMLNAYANSGGGNGGVPAWPPPSPKPS